MTYMVESSQNLTLENLIRLEINHIQETTGQVDPLLRAGVQLQMTHLRGCQAGMKLGTAVVALETEMQRSLEPFFSHSIVDSGWPNMPPHLWKPLASLQMTSHVQTSKESN